ncbi:methyltransferase domain-containing protein [Pseudonocardia sp. Cha107L01]|uniref:methyltransferase domain-containing protein n=1 Tax=Pseudonocardia sp. Cha107L01 TaxID=3457576 RepID=UPI00403EF201
MAAGHWWWAVAGACCREAWHGSASRCWPSTPRRGRPSWPAPRPGTTDRTSPTGPTAPAEDLGVPAGTFDVAYLADTLEITPELDRVLEQARLTLRPGGVLFYDTVNRTLLARLVYLVVFQGLPLTRIMPPGRYAASRLRGPGELGEALARHGLRNEDVCDFKPRNPASLLKAVLARRRGAITDEQIPPIVDFVRVPDGSPLVTYLGYARKV